MTSSQLARKLLENTSQETKDKVRRWAKYIVYCHINKKRILTLHCKNCKLQNKLSKQFFVRNSKDNL